MGLANSQALSLTHTQTGKRKRMWRLSGCSTEDMPEEKPKSPEKAGLCLNNVKKFALLFSTVFNVLCSDRRALSYLHSVTGFLLRQ